VKRVSQAAPRHEADEDHGDGQQEREVRAVLPRVRARELSPLVPQLAGLRRGRRGALLAPSASSCSNDFSNRRP
jgi:hypothetical protein